MVIKTIKPKIHLIVTYINQVAHLVNDHYLPCSANLQALMSYYSCYTMASGLVRGGLVRSSLLSTKHSATTQWMIATRLAL